MLANLILRFAPTILPNIARQLGLLIAGSLLTVGVLDEAGVELVSGAIVALVMGGWALAEKKGLVKQLLG